MMENPIQYTYYVIVWTLFVEPWSLFESLIFPIIWQLHMWQRNWLVTYADSHLTFRCDLKMYCFNLPIIYNPINRLIIIWFNILFHLSVAVHLWVSFLFIFFRLLTSKSIYKSSFDEMCTYSFLFWY